MHISSVNSRSLPNSKVGGFAADCADSSEVSGNDLKLLKLLQARTTASTRRAYDTDLRHFAAWSDCLPTTPIDVARYLAAHAGQLSVATLARRLVAIGQAHTVRGFPNPTTADLVRLTMRGIRRTYGTPQRRVAALTRENLFSIVSLMGDAPTDLRDRALLLVGFAGAFRRSELVAIDYQSVQWVVQGCLITIPKSKSDQEGRGREILIPYGRPTTCPVSAFQAWLSTSGITDGAVFRSLHKGGRVAAKRLSPGAVAKIVKRRANAAGFDSSRYSGHSLRAGFVTSATSLGMPSWKIKAQTGHASDDMVSRYIRGTLGHGSDDSIL